MIDEKPRYNIAKLIMLCFDSDKKRAILEFLENKGTSVQLKDIVTHIRKVNLSRERSNEYVASDVAQDCRYMTELGILKKTSEQGKKGAYFQLDTEILKIVNLFTDKLNNRLTWEK